MFARTSKVILVLGLVVGTVAILLSLFTGSHLNWTSHDGGANININIASASGPIVMALGAFAIVALILGSAFLALARQSVPPSTESAPGAAPAAGFSFASFAQNLRKSSTDRQLGGVCGGLGEYSSIPAWVWRMIFLLLIFCFGIGIISYIVLYLCMPSASAANAPSFASTPACPIPFSFLTFLQQLRKSRIDCPISGICGGLGEHSPIPSWIWRALFLALIPCGGIGLLAYLILWLCMPDAPPIDTHSAEAPHNAVASAS